MQLVYFLFSQLFDQILYQFISNQLKKIINPRGIFNIKYEKNNIDEKFMASIISFIF